MTDVLGLLSGRAGVLVHLGTGLDEFPTGIVDAYLDRAPLVAIRPR